MKTGEGPRPFCPICLETLGECQDDNNNGHVALTRCGHLCCKKCMTHWIRQKESNRVHPSCIECRKPVYRNQIVYVDPKKAGDEKEFKERQGMF